MHENKALFFIWHALLKKYYLITVKNDLMLISKYVCMD